MASRPRSGADFDRLGNVWETGVGWKDLRRLDLTARFIKEHVGDPSVAVECGPLRGEITVRLLQEFPRADLHLVEIAPSHAAALRERFTGDSRVRVHEADMLSLRELPVPQADAVLLIECLYYLSQTERETFVGGLRHAHPAATVIIATPITGVPYFTESTLSQLFVDYELSDFRVLSQDRSLSRGWARRVMDVADRLDVEEPAMRLLGQRGIADHVIYAFNPH